MNIKKHPFYTKKFLEFNGFGKMYHYRILTTPFAKLSPKSCLFWTIIHIINKLKSFEQDDLSLRTIKELEKIPNDYSKDKAKIFDELSFKNWRNRTGRDGTYSVHLPLARISWACLFFICLQHKYEFKSSFRFGNNVVEEVFKNLHKTIGWECGITLSMLFESDAKIAEDLALSYSKFMNEIENKNYS